MPVYTAFIMSLSGFYKDTKRYAFQTQLFFLLSRYKQQSDFHQVDIFSKSIVSDYMFIKDRIFAALNLDDNELKFYVNGTQVTSFATETLRL